jgi:hypothetical protein
MRNLNQVDRHRVQVVIDRNRELLLSIPNALGAEPGFPIVQGKLLREPAIILYVASKLPRARLLPEDFAPGEVEGVRLDVMQADPWKQIELNPGLRALQEEIETAAAATIPYEGLPDDPIDASFEISKPILCAVGPDQGWTVLRDFLGGTRNTLNVAMYDFSADYISNTLIEVVRANDVKVELTLDDGIKDTERDIQERLEQKLGDLYDAEVIRCAKSRRFPSAYHPKVAVQDHKRFWLSSGNWSPNSQPDIDPIGHPAGGWFSKGNREWHVVVEDVALAKLFERYIAHDKKESESDAALAGEERPTFPDLFVPLGDLLGDAALAAADPVAPEKILSGQSARVRPLLSPDNYARRISEWIRGAQKSLDLQYSYINYSERAEDEDFKALLDDIGKLSWKDDFTLRIIVGSGADDAIRRLAQNGFNEAVFKVQSKIHNKGIVRDGTEVLVSSQNWSGDGFLRNRDAGLIIEDREVAQYFAGVFDEDWKTRARPPFETAGLAAVIAPDNAPPPAGMVRMSWSDFFGD